MFMSLEFALDDIDKQLNRLKERRLEIRKEIAREKAKSREEIPPSLSEILVEEKLSIAKPLDVEEALMILQDENRYFLVFRNSSTGELNVIYRKKTGKYGLIAP